MKKIVLILIALAMVTLTVSFGFAQICECGGAGKVTGGGIYRCICAGDKITYGFNVVRFPGETSVKGELEYQDHTLRLNVHAHDIDTLCVSADGTKAVFTGPCTINHEEGFSFRVYVEDNGEPGCGNSGKGTDVFEMELFGLTYAYHSIGNPINGGNIQIHWALPDP